MKYTLIKNPMDSPAQRAEYNRLAKETFGLDFEGWYSGGYFDGNHIPYTVFDGDTAVANISVNLMDVQYGSTVKRYIQLGTVMTSPVYRGQGLQKIIFDTVINDFSDKCDAVFLFANRTVTDFYPKLGFEKAVEYTFEKNIIPQTAIVKKLDMTDDTDMAFFRKYYDKGNRFSDLEVKNGFALEMFYCSGPYSENVFYIEKYDAVVVAETDENSVTCLDIFGGEYCTTEEIMSAFGREKLIMGFTPQDKTGFEIKQLDDEDTVLFVYTGGENIFSGNQLLFPLISHT